jgi:DNA-binding response OmpR family regulator
MFGKVLYINDTVKHPTCSRLLIKEGYRVDTVYDVSVGLQYLHARAYDIIILQENPEAESWQLCDEIRRLSGIPLIVISRNASTETCVRAINAGADYFLRKPFGPLEFIARVQSLLQRVTQKQAAPAIH